VEGGDAVVLVSGHARFEAALRGASNGTFADGFHRLPMLLAKDAVSQASAANPRDGSRIVEAIGLQWVAESVKAMAAMDVVLAAVDVRDEVANERLAALRSNAARAAFWPKVSIVELRTRVAAMAPSSTSSRALLAKMSQERTYLWYAVLMWCKAWVTWILHRARSAGGAPVDTRLWELLLFMSHRLEQLQDVLVDADGPAEQAPVAPTDASAATEGGPSSRVATPVPAPGFVSPVGGLGAGVVMDISLRNISMHYIRIHFGYAPGTHILHAL